MKRKMLTLEGISGSAKEKVLSITRLIRELGKDDSKDSSPNPLSMVAQHNPVNALVYNSLEAEQKKAQALMYSRLFDKPK